MSIGIQFSPSQIDLDHMIRINQTIQNSITQTEKIKQLELAIKNELSHYNSPKKIFYLETVKELINYNKLIVNPPK
ncbi:MAG TPA: hypothetical protein PKD96_04915 [Candidatus Absconditabacterales bacterium]|nr:hypothetical protein [Candidatus Absconditabacterales bacterium]HMT27624.1 hypothetical protein [Candidatus Absconditabacterales bacterium]